MEIIIHRVNTLNELKTIDDNYGIEIDIRAYNSNLILNHEPFCDGDKLIDLLYNILFSFLQMDSCTSYLGERSIRKTTI